MKPIQEALEELFSDSFAVFFGAGLSIRSGLPSAESFICDVLKRLPLDDIKREELFEAITSRLPFEAFIETLQDLSDINSLIDIFEGAVPNRNHMLLAQLMVTGKLHLICTTNFDDLLEQALAQLGWNAEGDYLLVSDLSSFSTIDWGSDAPKVVKVHGSVSNREDMAITLKQVASRQAFEPRKKAIENVFSTGPHARTLVLGYSCSDVFDICPHIESLRPSTNVLLIEHDTGTTSVEGIQRKGMKNPFGSYEGTRLYTNTDDVMDFIAELANIKLDPREADPPRSMQNCVHNWINGIHQIGRLATLNHISACLFSKLSLHDSVLEYCARALSYSKGITSFSFKGPILANAATSYRHLGRFDKAIDKDLEALRIARQHLDRESEADCLGNLCLSYIEIGKSSEAIQCGIASLEIFRALKNERGIARQLGSLGSIYHRVGDLSNSQRYHSESLEMCKRLGFKVWEANQLGGLGKVHLRRGEYSKAIDYFEEAKRIAEETGEEHVLTNQLNDIAIAWSGLAENLRSSFNE